jgi:hypothetical protein
MTPLTANLKHLYQRRGMLLLYVLLAVMSLPLYMMAFARSTRGIDPGVFAFPWLIVFLVGSYCSDHVVGILNCPLSFCLPGHQKAARRFLAILGVALSAVIALVFLVYPGLAGPTRLIALVAAFCVNLTCYGFGAAMRTTKSRAKGALAAALAGWIWVLILAAMYFDFHVAVVNAIVEGSLALMGVCLALCGLIWLRWGNRDVARQVCANPQISVFGAWNPEKGRRMAQARWASTIPRTGVAPLSERLFLARMAAHPALSAGRSVWGGLYAAFGGGGIVRGKGLAFMPLFLGLYLGYLGLNAPWAIFVLVSFVAGTTGILSCLYSTLPVPSGRRERFLIGIAAAIAASLAIVACLGGMVLLTHLIAPLAPAVNLKGEVFSFRPVQPWGLWIPLVVVPAAQAVRLMWPRMWPLAIIVLFTVCMPAIIGASAAGTHEGLLLGLTLPVAVAIPTISWSVFLAVLRRVCFRRSLVI